ncbi:beta-ketoacyl synthase [Nostoc sp. FACHB-892]|uniref:beta-ketoacyl synthase N-terminal-like domain-containing protein n=1 Tax=Nostoc sp. FACHB-892 TaxID=2692843 RepID=UPI00168653BC|nr:beta-ketoacyl synthase N-terminal-like domain-containing protein [Nostoc sp. FACHB-892]MBD2729717.1 beta-ketoacyl synthase [Nostoc sp. FACHB-892]
MEKIAIIGLSCLFPDAKNPDEFWQNIIDGKDSTSSITSEELGVKPEVFYDYQKGKADKFYSLQGGFIRDFKIDNSEYKLPQEFIESLDNTFKWLLYAAKQAIQQSGYSESESALSKCGVILGNLSSATKFSHHLFTAYHRQLTEYLIKELLQQEDFYLPSLPAKAKPSLCNGMISSFPAALIAQAFSLSNIHFCLDAACSASFYAIKLASHYLWSHKADLMLAGAISCGDPLAMRMGFSVIQAYPENGISRPFDKSSGGVITADGTGIVVLKRYSDAIRDGDKILATICGNGLSNDGKGKHLLSPNSKGQILAFERAYNEAQISPKAIDYLECHATGTSLGDPVELNSIETFFGQHQATPLLGAVKANVGHLLNAAGMVSLAKVILSMSHGIIPPTINVTDPISSKNGLISAEQIVRAATSWPDNSPIKRAAINAFGFGGSNSHLILEQGETPEPVDNFTNKNSQPVQPAKIAIVGMDVFFGDCDGLEAFESSVYEGIQHFIPLPPNRWRGIEDQNALLKEHAFADGKAPVGAYVKDFEIDTLTFKIPPNEVERLNPQQTLMLKVANRAVRDAGLQGGGNVAVIIAAESELSSHGIYQRWHTSWQLEEALIAKKVSLPTEKIAQLETVFKDDISKAVEPNEYVSYIANITASRISALWNFNGPSFTITAGENSVFKAMDVAQMLLTTGEVDTVVVGAVDLAGGFENVWLRNQLAKTNTGVNTLSYDQFSNGWNVGEGAGAVVLKRHDTAKQNGDRIYAVIDAISFTHHYSTQSELNNGLPTPDAKAVNQACEQAFNIAGIQSTDVDYLEVFGSGIPQQDEAEITGLLQAYQRGTDDLDCALGSVKANIGHTFVASGIASLIKTALCLYHRYIPATPKWSGVKTPQIWQDSPFYVAPKSTPWLLNKEGMPRIAAINSMGIDGTCSHLILSEELSQNKRPRHSLGRKSPYLFLVAFDNYSELGQQISNLQEAIDNTFSLAVVAKLTFTTFKQRQEAKYTLAIVGSNKQELSQEIKLAHKGVKNATERGIDWQTPLGSYFTANPLGKKGAVACVYPSLGSSYLGISQDIFRLLPEVFDSLSSMNSDVAETGKLLYPRSLSKLSNTQLEALEKQFLANAKATSQIEAQIAGFYTSILQYIFKLQPKFVFGFSLGEITMMFAQGAWRDLDQEKHPHRFSWLYDHTLSGSKEALRKYWGLPNIDSKDNNLWNTYILLAAPSQVQECIRSENRVYITMINSPREVVIAGEKQACERVIKSLNCNAIHTPLDLVVHCPPVQSEYDRLVKDFTISTKNAPGIIFYSAADYAPLTLESSAIAHSFAKVICQQIDFPRLVNRVYEDGARIFIELGAGSGTSRLIDQILDSKEHIALSLNRKGINDHTSLIRTLAKLISHQVTLDLSPLYSQDQEASTSNKSMPKTITLGGARIIDIILSEENRKLFQNLLSKQQPDTQQYQQMLLPKESQPTTSLTGKNTKYQNVIATNNSNLCKAHAAFLQARQGSSKQISDIIQLEIACVQKLINRQSR